MGDVQSNPSHCKYRRLSLKEEDWTQLKKIGLGLYTLSNGILEEILCTCLVINPFTPHLEDKVDLFFFWFFFLGGGVGLMDLDS